MHCIVPTFSCAVVRTCRTAEIKCLPWGCHVAPVSCKRSCSARLYLRTAVSAAWRQLSDMCLTQRTLPPNPRNHCNCRTWHNCSGNLQTKLLRGCCGQMHLWLGYIDRGSGQAQPDRPLQSCVSVGLEVPKGNQRGQQSGREGGADRRQQYFGHGCGGSSRY